MFVTIVNHVRQLFRAISNAIKGLGVARLLRARCSTQRAQVSQPFSTAFFAHCTFLTGHTNSHPVYPYFIVYSLLQVVINIYSVYHKIFTDPIENADLLGENGVEKILFVVLYMGG